MKAALQRQNLMITFGEAMMAATAAATAVLLGLEIWAMFVGWIAYFTRGQSLGSGAVNLVCVIIGQTIGAAAALVLSAAAVSPGVLEQAVVVLGVGVIVLSLRFLPLFNNLLAFFLGLVAWFAAHPPVSFVSLMVLALAATLGSVAGWLAQYLQRWLTAAHGKAGGAST